MYYECARHGSIKKQFRQRQTEHHVVASRSTCREKNKIKINICRREIPMHEYFQRKNSKSITACETGAERDLQIHNKRHVSRMWILWKCCRRTNVIRSEHNLFDGLVVVIVFPLSSTFVEWRVAIFVVSSSKQVIFVRRVWAIVFTRIIRWYEFQLLK